MIGRWTDILVRVTMLAPTFDFPARSMIAAISYHVTVSHGSLTYNWSAFHKGIRKNESKLT